MKKFFFITGILFLFFFIPGCDYVIVKKVPVQPEAVRIRNDKTWLLDDAAGELNRSLPVTTEGLRIDSAEVLPGKIMQLNYTFINLAKNEIDTSQLALFPVEEMKSGLQALGEVAGDVTLVFSYRDREGALVYEFKAASVRNHN